MTQMSLLDYRPRFFGSSFDESIDGPRLGKQQAKVNELMGDGEWRSLQSIARITGYPEASISARLRGARHPQHGGWTVERKRIGEGRGTWVYRFIKPEQGI